MSLTNRRLLHRFQNVIETGLSQTIQYTQTSDLHQCLLLRHRNTNTERLAPTLCDECLPARGVDTGLHIFLNRNLVIVHCSLIQQDPYSITMTEFNSTTTSWENQNSIELMDDLSLDEWQSVVTADDFDIMEVDQQINLLDDDLLQDPCASPTGPLEELCMTMDLEEGDVPFLDFFFDDIAAQATDDADSTSSLPFDERYKATLSKLQESMKRSQETRKSLKMKSPKLKDYETRNLSFVLSSIEQSTGQLQDYLTSLRSAAA